MSKKGWVYNVVYLDEQEQFYDVNNYSTLTLACNGDLDRGIPGIDTNIHKYHNIQKKLLNDGIYKRMNVIIKHQPVYKNIKTKKS